MRTPLFYYRVLRSVLGQENVTVREGPDRFGRTVAWIEFDAVPMLGIGAISDVRVRLGAPGAIATVERRADAP